LDLDGIVLAEAGLKRLGRSQEIDQVIPKETILPAAGQGCLAVLIRSKDTRTGSIVRQIDDRETKLCVSSERAFSKEVGGGCNEPVAALATIDRGILTLEGLISDSSSLEENGFVEERITRQFITGPPAEGEKLGRELAHNLMRASGGRD
jgi:hydroxymethylbilane synthase